jgi:small-conductance mechanosensitive channel
LGRLAALLLLLAALLPGGAARAEGDWTGTWRIHWREAGAELVIVQAGDRVSGEYPLYNGRIEGRVAGRTFEGTWFEGDLSGTMTAVISRDGQRIVGRHDDREWFSGTRIVPKPPVALSFATPQESLRAFLSQGARGRAGEAEAWGQAARAVDFGAATHRIDRREKIARVRALYALVDLTTFRLATLPVEIVEATAKISLPQPSSGASLPLVMLRDGAGRWRIHMPSDAEMADHRRALLASRGGQMPASDAFRTLRSPRDAMRALLEGTTRWDTDDGRALALSALDLTHIPDRLRPAEGGLAALMLRRILAMIGFDNLQSIPDDGRDRLSVELFVHPQGRIAIAPSGPAADAPWRFTAETVANVDEVFRSLDEVGEAEHNMLGPIPGASYFTLRDIVAHRAPVLLRDIGHAEYWQLLAAVALAALAAVVALLLSLVLRRVLEHVVRGRLPRRRVFSMALTLLIGLVVAQPIPAALGIPENIRHVTSPMIGILLTVSAAAVAWHLLEVLAMLASGVADRAASLSDDILFSLLLAAARLMVVLAAMLMTADYLSIPASSIIAGLGIGGLALAFASRETLSNVFGAGILVADRPFRRGDWIVAGDVEGAIEQVGIRSTRVRTADGSVMVVPNGTLADSVIDNRGARPRDLVRLAPVVTAGATPERLDAFLADVRRFVTDDPRYAGVPAQVAVSGISESGIALAIEAGLAAGTQQARREAQEALILALVRLAALHGVQLGGGMAGGEEGSTGTPREDPRGRHEAGSGHNAIDQF